MAINETEAKNNNNKANIFATIKGYSSVKNSEVFDMFKPKLIYEERQNVLIKYKCIMLTTALWIGKYQIRPESRRKI